MVVITVTQRTPFTIYGLTIMKKVTLILEEAPIPKVDLAHIKTNLVNSIPSQI